MKNLDSFKEEAESTGLTLMGLTGASNGYPDPDLGWFAFGFKTIDEAKEFAEKFNCEVSEAEWRDGWGYAHYLCDTDEPFNVTSEWYGDDYRICEEMSVVPKYSLFFSHDTYNQAVGVAFLFDE